MPRPLSSRMKSVSALFILAFLPLLIAAMIVPLFGDPRPQAPHTTPPPGYADVLIGSRGSLHHALVKAWAATASRTLLFASCACLLIGVIVSVLAGRQTDKERGPRR